MLIGWGHFSTPNQGAIVINRKQSKIVIVILWACFIALAFPVPFFAAKSARAEELRYPEQQVFPGQQVSPAENSMQKPSGQQDDWKITLGVGTMYKPAFLGSKDYQMMAFPDIKIEYKDRFFASLFGVGYKVICNDVWSIGPIVKLDFGRTENDDNPFRIAGEKTHALRGLGNVDATVELGGFVEYNIGPFTYQLEMRQGVGGHQGFVIETGFDFRGFIDKPGKPIMYSVGPHLTFADSNYNNAYFGITRSQSINSGLSRYDATAGVVSYGIGGFVMVPLSDTLSVGVFGGYDRLANGVADSPLIKKRGDPNQFMGGLRLSYEFGY